jgi:hypothetical protein
MPLQVGWGTRALGTQDTTAPTTDEAAKQTAPPGVPTNFFDEKAEKEHSEKYRTAHDDEKTPIILREHERYTKEGLHESISARSSGTRDGLEVYHDYLPQLAKTPDLEYGGSKPEIRLR